MHHVEEMRIRRNLADTIKKARSDIYSIRSEENFFLTQFGPAVLLVDR
jgi:hypothetical protein